MMALSGVPDLVADPGQEVRLGGGSLFGLALARLELGNRGLRALQRRARIVRGDFGGMVLGRLIRRGLIERRFRAGRRRGKRSRRRQTLVELAGELVEGAAFDRAQGRNDRLAGRAQRHHVLGGGRCGRGARGRGCLEGAPDDIAAHAEAAIAAKDALAVEYRQPGQLDHETFAAIVQRPGDAQPAPGVIAGQRLRDPALGIERQCGGELRPRAAKRGRGGGSHQSDEFVAGDRESLIRIDLPDEPKRNPPRGRGVRNGWQRIHLRPHEPFGRRGRRGLPGRVLAHQDRNRHASVGFVS